MSTLNYFEEIERTIADTLLKEGYCLGVPDFTPGDVGQTKGNLELATKLTYALAEKGFMRALYAATKAANELDAAIEEVESKSAVSEGVDE